MSASLGARNQPADRSALSGPRPQRVVVRWEHVTIWRLRRVTAPDSAASPVFLEPRRRRKPSMPDAEPNQSSTPERTPPVDAPAEPPRLTAHGRSARRVSSAAGVARRRPAVIDDEAEPADAVERLRAGTGPLAVDAERASSYRYGHRAYLVQLRREGTGILLIDPISCPDLSAVGAAVSDVEWIVHAANQDLPCLADLGM